MTKIRVALICNITNPRIQSNLKLKVGLIDKFARRIRGSSYDVSKLAGECNVFIENAIHEYEKCCDSMEFHIISAHGWMDGEIQEFEQNGIFYHFFQNENQSLKNRILYRVIPSTQFSNYKNNRRKIANFISKISPDIVYMSGAENPHYSLSALDIPSNIPVIVQLQTLMCDPNFENNYPISHESYIYRTSIEKKVLNRANFIGSMNVRHDEIIREFVKNDAMILKTRLAIGEKLFDGSGIRKDYDFVYFAANINKSLDLAIEAFAIAHKIKNKCTLHIVGDYSLDYKCQIDLWLKELGLEDYVTFTGRLPTHEDVLHEICRAKIALLPLKIDIVSGTIREAMACGLPVVTTITKDGTPRLNDKRQTVLLSEIGNHQALADNMLRLLDKSDLAEKLIENGKILIQERYSNEAIVQQQKKCLFAAVDYFKNKTPIPREYLS